MKYTPKEIEENINVSPNSPLTDFFILSGGLIGFFLIVFILLGLSINVIANKLPPSAEKKIAGLFQGLYQNDSEDSIAQKKIQSLLDSLKDSNIDYKINIQMEEQVNAFALPGQQIIIFSKLIEEAETENELAFVLAHEIGHFKNKDHLKLLGRKFALFGLSAIFLGENNSVTDFLSKQLSNVDMKFSQNQEIMADIYALELLNNKYGHVNGSTDFFKKVAKENRLSQFQYYFATHPHPEKRIKIIEDKIKEKSYKKQEKIKLSKEFIQF